LIEPYSTPPAKASSQHIELAAISQPGDLRGVRSAPVSGSNLHFQGISGASTGREQMQQ